MNKDKLRSLMFHAGFCNEDGGWDDRPLFEQEHDNFQRFVELIVRECIDQLYYTREERMDDTICQAIKERIEKHFGVKE